LRHLDGDRLYFPVEKEASLGRLNEFWSWINAMYKVGLPGVF